MAENILIPLIVLSLWAAIGLFYWQYRECCAVQKRERTLEKKNAEMTCFVYGAAHDLKAPLRAVIQANDRLYDALKDSLSSDQQEDFILLRQRAQRMTRLIDDLLAYWQAGQSTDLGHNYTINIGDLVRDVVSLLSPPAGFSIVIDPVCEHVRLCHMPMRQILMNLIGNAIKHHGGTCGVVKISCVDEGQFYRFCIADDGQGVPDAYKKKIFEPFETLRSRDDVEGSGLGLSLVKRILDRQKCAIYVADAPQGGAEFYFTWRKMPRD